MAGPAARLLIVDFLDSYTHNLPSYVRGALQETIPLSFDVLPYTELGQTDVHAVSLKYDGIILSPGPGTVDCADDLGHFVPALLAYRPAIPVFGVCLGFQAICKHFGGAIKRLGMPHHGLISEIHSPDGKALGRKATRYHSLEVIVSSDLKEKVELLAYSGNYNDASQTLQEVKVRGLPFWGVQYHPESIYSVNCEAVVRPFLQAAIHRATTIPHRFSEASGTASVNIERANSFQPSNINAGLSASSSSFGTPVPSEVGSIDSQNYSLPTSQGRFETSKSGEEKRLLWKSIPMDLDVPALIRSSGFPSKDFVLLDSATKGDWDILAFAETSWSFRYSCRKQEYIFGPLSSLRHDSAVNVERDAASLNDMWAFLQGYSARSIYVDGPPQVPFWGGFIGYFSYELGLEQLGLDPYPQQYAHEAPDYDDIQLLWSTETVLHHRGSKTVYLLSLDRDHTWLAQTESMLRNLVPQPHAVCSIEGRCPIMHPTKENYIDAIRQCQELINAGESYELCLTAPSDLHFIAATQPGDPRESRTELYAALREDNPAAFMSILNLGGVNFVSASPEEFLSYDASTRTAIMKPIKGTLSKKHADGTPICLCEAQGALKVPKVVAENLMIVDLVRNDLAKVADSVTCPNLLFVEELEHMYQLVSTIEAKVSAGRDAWDLLKSALPPGSMTGAPKRRSCQLLQRIEKNVRGLYSGVVGYVDVRGNCRTSVSIRNATQYPGLSQWKLGAGGAVTSLSDPLDEWHERQLKAQSVCRSFEQRFELLETVLWNPEAGGLVHWDNHIKRLLKSLQHFSFRSPLQALPELTPSEHKNPDAFLELSTMLAKWVRSEIPEPQRQERLRLSIKINSKGAPSLSIMPIGAAQTAPLKVCLDPHATRTDALEPFISYKTSIRDHYVSARARGGAQGREEVLLFRPAQPAAITQDGKPEPTTQPGQADDLLTEGSYTNVAVYSESRSAWITPSDGCLKGIERARLLSTGDVVEGEVRRRDLVDGTRIRLFNSVRGCFEGVISLP